MSKLRHEVISNCNICKSGQKVLISSQDRYGFQIRTAICRLCGLIYIVDRFTSEGYTEFYESGGYRELITRFKGYKQTVDKIQASQVNYSEILLKALNGYIVPRPGAKLLDIGGSTGLVAYDFTKHYGFTATVLDPAPNELAATRKLGLETIASSLETYRTQEKYDLILLCRTIEHLFDLNAALTKIRELLQPEGLFYCDIVDFIETCRREGPPEVVTKIDHCFWLCQETAVNIFQALGFEIVSIHILLAPDQVGYLLRLSDPSSRNNDSLDWVDQQIRTFREIKSDWDQYGRKPLDIVDRFRRYTYRIKKRMGTYYL